MNIPTYAEPVWGDETIEEPDGTFSVKLSFYLDGQKITGLPNKRVALEIAYALSQAYDAGAENYAMSCN